MRLTVKELIARAYEVARLLKDADAALLREVATRLDVTHVALSEALELNHHLTAENVALKSFITKECFIGHIEPETFYEEEVTRYVPADGYEPETPATDRFIAEQQAQAHKEGAHFVANRMLAAWDAGFIDDTAKNAADIARMILTSTEFMSDAPDGDFDRSFADGMLAEIAQQLRDEVKP